MGSGSTAIGMYSSFSRAFLVFFNYWPLERVVRPIESIGRSCRGLRRKLVKELLMHGGQMGD